MAIISAMQSAALVLVGRKPASFFSTSEKFEMEIADLINEVAEDVARYQDWQALQTIDSLTGNGTITVFDLPSDYSRMMKSTAVQGAPSFLWGRFAYGDLSEFIRDQALGFRALPGGWIITGGQIKFCPAPTGVTTFVYISSNWARSSDGTVRKSQFDADTDTFVLPERLLKLGLIWRWRENKKLDASGDQEAFIKALDEYAFSDAGARVYRHSGRQSFPGTHLAWPGLLG